MPTSIVGAILFLALFQSPQAPTVPASRFVGTWVGTQSWAIENPPPGARPDQPVTLTIDFVDGRLVGTMMPFMGGQDGATFVDARIVGEELLVTAVVGRPRAMFADAPPDGGPPARGRGARGGPPPRNWKDLTRISFAFKNDGVNLSGTADVTMGDVKWLTFNYALSRKRSRY